MNKAPVLMALVSALLFGAAAPASKFLLEGLNPFQLAGLLYLGAALAVAPSALRSNGLGLPSHKDTHNQLRLLGAIVFGGILGPVALLSGLRLAGAASVSLWLNLELAATAVLGILIFRDHLGGKGWIGIALAIAASMIVAWAPGNTGLTAGILVLMACLCWGLDNHLTALIDGITPSQSTFWKGVIAGLVNLIIGTSFSSIPVEMSGDLLIDLPLIVIALIVGALSYGASIVLYIHSAQSIGATRAQVLFASAPFFGVALSVVFLGESLSFMHLVATLLFIVGAGLLMIEDHAHLHTHKLINHKHLHRHDDGHHNHQHPGFDPRKYHSHEHTHEPIRHSHQHWPDLHHRHTH